MARRLGEMLLWRCEDRFSDESSLCDGDVLVPMPGWLGRRLRRGFNPSLRLAEGISEILGWPIWCSLLRVHGGRMAGKSREQRRLASRRLFRMRSRGQYKWIMNSNLWIVDDMLVSGGDQCGCWKVAPSASPTLRRFGVANVRN